MHRIVWRASLNSLICVQTLANQTAFQLYICALLLAFDMFDP